MSPTARRLLAGLLLLSAARVPAEGEIFIDVSQEVDLDFEHHNGMSGKFYFCEPVGAGAALFDFDNDGDLDIYLVQGQMLGSDADPTLTDRLFRNDLEITADGRRTVKLVEITARSRLQSTGYGMGVSTGDYDNDGDPDLYVTNLGSNQLWRNNGDGTFSDVTTTAGADDDRWSVSATFVDYDHDGWLDLYVTNYVDFTVGTHKACLSKTGSPAYCGPLAYNPQPDRLLRNRGDGTFERATVTSGVAAEYGSGLGVATADFNGDGWTDLYVANDQVPNQMWINAGDGTFHNDAMFAGTALNAEGIPEASMGVAVADIDGDGDEDLILSHLGRETNTLYLNEGDGFFADASRVSGLGGPSLKYTGFGLGWLDYDNDGLLDFIVVNGAVKSLEHLERQGDPYPLHQPNQLFRNLGGTRFEEVTADAGAVFQLSEVSRGVALGDIDNDGDHDVLMSNNRGRARLLINTVGQDRAWIGVRLVGRGGRDLLDAQVGVERSASPILWRRLKTGGSYASASDPRALFGLDQAQSAGPVHVVDPEGTKIKHPPPRIRRHLTLRSTAGRRAAEDP
jgi:hypothetical protein